jgi:5'-3' exonuclease
MKVLLLDGYNLIYRARHSRMNKGDHSIIFNFFRSLRPIIEKFNPDKCYFTLEGRPTQRLNIDPNYKGQRVYHNKDNFSEQRREIIRLVKEYFPFTTIRHNDFECDDVIGHLASVTYKDDDVVIISSDTDFIQSINENTQVYSPVRKCFLEKTEYDYVAWKSLVGDKSDNIEGFLGIGNKKAQKLLSDSKLLEDFLLKEDNKEKYDKNFFMVKFHDLNDKEEEFEKSKPSSCNWEGLKKEFINLEFNSIIGKEKSWEKYINTFSNLERNI